MSWWFMKKIIGHKQITLVSWGEFLKSFLESYNHQWIHLSF